MEQLINSDLDPTMVTTNAYEKILDQIMTSNLNFQIQMSPFSAVISLKKSLIKNKSGVPILPPVSRHSEASEGAKNTRLKEEIKCLRDDLTKSTENLDASNKVITDLINQKEHKLEADVKSKLNEKNNLPENLNFKISKLESENITNKLVIENLKIELKELEISKRKSDDIANNLNKKLSDAYTKFKAEKDNMVKDHRAKVKSWRINSSNERKLRVFICF